MFGYIRPVETELKVCEFEQFKACYCALCHSLGENYGSAARFVLNYDFVFLTMLLWQEGDSPGYEHRRCPASPCKKKTCCAASSALEICAGYSIILAWWKIRDSIADSGLLGSIPHRMAAIVLGKAYRKAAGLYPDFDLKVRTNLTELTALEKSRSVSLDRAADKFAMILSALAQQVPSAAKRRALEQLLYHVGRWIYIIDACDDLKEDSAEGRYNPVAARFEIKDGKLSTEDRETLKTTLMHSRNLAGSAFELLPQSAWTGTVKNIIYLGMPQVCARVLNGTWKKPRRRVPR